MRAIDAFCGMSDERAREEIIATQCPQNFEQFRGLTKLCSGDYDKAAMPLCQKCWYQQAETGGKHE